MKRKAKIREIKIRRQARRTHLIFMNVQRPRLLLEAWQRSRGSASCQPSQKPARRTAHHGDGGKSDSQVRNRSGDNKGEVQNCKCKELGHELRSEVGALDDGVHGQPAFLAHSGPELRTSMCSRYPSLTGLLYILIRREDSRATVLDGMRRRA